MKGRVHMRVSIARTCHQPKAYRWTPSGGTSVDGSVRRARRAMQRLDQAAAFGHEEGLLMLGQVSGRST